MQEIFEYILRIFLGLVIAVITGFVRRLYRLQDEQSKSLSSQHDEQIRQDERLKNLEHHTEHRFGELDKRLEHIEQKLENLPEKIAQQLRRELK